MLKSRLLFAHQKTKSTKINFVIILKDGFLNQTQKMKLPKLKKLLDTNRPNRIP